MASAEEKGHGHDATHVHEWVCSRHDRYCSMYGMCVLSTSTVSGGGPGLSGLFMSSCVNYQLSGKKTRR